MIRKVMAKQNLHFRHLKLLVPVFALDIEQISLNTILLCIRRPLNVSCRYFCFENKHPSNSCLLQHVLFLSFVCSPLESLQFVSIFLEITVPKLDGMIS